MSDFVSFGILFAVTAGLLVGSFLNVCIYRVPRDLSVVRPRSFCPECGTAIAWYDNIPLLSFAGLRGRCRECRKAIPRRYPMVELATGVMFGFVVWRYDLTLAAAKWFCFEAILIVLFWTDFEERLLPDEFTLGGAVVGLIFAALVPLPGFPASPLLPTWAINAQSLANALSAAALLSIPLWAFGAIYKIVRHRVGLELGDIKLLVMLGAFLGVHAGVLALLIAAVGGSVLGLAYVWIRRQSASSYELPFGSFLCAAAALLPLVVHI